MTRTDAGVAIAGEVDVETWADLSGALSRAVRNPSADRIVVDLSGLSFIDARGLRIVAEAAGKLRPPRHLSLIHVPPGMRRIAEILELDRRPGLVFQEDDVA